MVDIALGRRVAKERFVRRLHQGLAAGLAGALALCLWGCGEHGGAPAQGNAAPAGGGKAPAVPVNVAKAKRDDAPILIRTIGTVQATAQVVIKPRVEGRVAEITGIEGKEVEAGDSLLVIDAKPFEARVREAEAVLARNRALSESAKYVMDRLQQAVESQAASERELKEAKFAHAAAEAAVMTSEAQLETAQLDLSYCKVTAPFSGRLGQFMVKPGSAVKANETELVELSTIDPIEVSFALPEERLELVRQAMRAGEVRVEAKPTAEGAATVSGKLIFVDNKVDVNTGTLRFKASFENPETRLWPGLYVSVTVIVGQDRGAIVVPEGAVQVTQDGTSIFVVKPDNTVELRTVSVKRTFDGISVIGEGIQEGEMVVTDGQLRLAPGLSVQPRTPGEAGGASPQAGAAAAQPNGGDEKAH